MEENVQISKRKRTIANIEKDIESEKKKLTIVRDKRYALSVKIKTHEDAIAALEAEKFQVIAERLYAMSDEKKNKYLAMIYEEEKQEKEAKRKAREEHKLLREAKKKNKETASQQV